MCVVDQRGFESFCPQTRSAAASLWMLCTQTDKPMKYSHGFDETWFNYWLSSALGECRESAVVATVHQGHVCFIAANRTFSYSLIWSVWKVRSNQWTSKIIGLKYIAIRVCNTICVLIINLLTSYCIIIHIHLETWYDLFTNCSKTKNTMICI